jgi:hypothetical protein
LDPRVRLIQVPERRKLGCGTEIVDIRIPGTCRTSSGTGDDAAEVMERS